MSYDVGCSVLARNFLSDYEFLDVTRERMIAELAQRIQDEIEKFISEYGLDDD